MKLQIKPEVSVSKDYPWVEDSWIYSAARSPDMIDKVIKKIGIENSEITRDIWDSIFEIAGPETFAPNLHSEGDPRIYQQIREAIRDWWKGIKVVEETSTELTQELPLFVLNSPALAGAKVTYGESESREDTLGWKVEVLGNGFGADLTLIVTQEGEFTSSAGDRKLVFAPLRARVVRAALYKRGVFQERFLKAELAETETREAHGIRSVSATEWHDLTSHREPADRFPLSGDRSNDAVKYRRKYSMKGSFESKLGLKAFDLETSLVAKYATEQTAVIAFELPPGRVYDLYRPSSMPGLFFDS